MPTHRPGPIVLTAREWQLVVALVEGCTNPEIAERLGISPHTVRNTLSIIYLKTGTSNRVRLTGLWLSGKLACAH